MIPSPPYTVIVGAGAEGTRALGDLPPVGPAQEQTLALDFGQVLPAGIFLMSAPTVTLSVVSGADATPQSRLLQPGAVGTVPFLGGGTGVAGAAVLFQVGTCQPGAVYLADVSCLASNGDVAEAAARFACVPA